MKRFHASSRRDVLLASGMLFAWPHLPKLAHAEGRDPRFLTIVLRGALDGLAAVAPIGDPDWTALRGDNALTLEGKTPALKLDDFFALNSAMPNLHHLFQGREAIIDHAAAHTLSGALAFRRAGPARKRSAQARSERQRLAQSRACQPRSRRPRQSEGPRAGGRSDHTADRAWPSAGPFMGAARHHAGGRRHDESSTRPLPARGRETRWRP